MYIYIYIYTHTTIYMYISTHTLIDTYLCIMYVYILICIFMCISTYVHIYIYMYIRIYIRMFIYTSKYTCIRAGHAGGSRHNQVLIASLRPITGMCSNNKELRICKIVLFFHAIIHHACMYVCMYVRMYVCMYEYILCRSFPSLACARKICITPFFIDLTQSVLPPNSIYLTPCTLCISHRVSRPEFLHPVYHTQSVSPPIFIHLAKQIPYI